MGDNVKEGSWPWWMENEVKGHQDLMFLLPTWEILSLIPHWVPAAASCASPSQLGSVTADVPRQSNLQHRCHLHSDVCWAPQAVCVPHTLFMSVSTFITICHIFQSALSLAVSLLRSVSSEVAGVSVSEHLALQVQRSAQLSQ